MISYVKVSVHDFLDFLTLSNYKPCADQLEDFKLGARLKPALYCVRQVELRLSVWQNGVLGGKGVVLVSVSANEICFYSATRVSTKGLEVNHRFELKTLTSEVCTKTNRQILRYVW